jgi:hypothetical protein
MKAVQQGWRSWRADLVVVSVAVLVAASLAFASSVAISLARQWVVLGSAWPWFPAGFFGPHEELAWQAAILAAGTLAWTLRRPVAQHIAVRASAAVAAAGLVALALVHQPWLAWDVSWPVTVGLLSGAGALAWIARARPPSDAYGLARSGHRLVLGLLLSAVAVGPSIAETIDANRQQGFPDFRVDFVAAVPSTESTPGAVLIDGAWFSLFEDDTLALDDTDVKRIRWWPEPVTHDPGIVVSFDVPTAAAVRARSLSHQGQYDAILIEGRRFMVVSYEAELLDGEMGLFVPPARRDDLEWLYLRLTGLDAPPEG